MSSSNEQEILVTYNGKLIKCTRAQLISAAAKGQVTPDTQVRISGKSCLAKQLPWLKFPNASPQVSANQSDQSFVPKFCPMCGQPVQQNVSFPQKFCSSCGYSFSQMSGVAQSKPLSLSKNPAQKGTFEESQKLLLLLKRDCSDIILFYRELFMVTLRFNPINLIRIVYNTVLEELNDDTPDEERVTLFGQIYEAMNKVADLSSEITNGNTGSTVLNKVFFLKWLDDIYNSVQELILNFRSELDKSFPSWRKYISHIWLDNPEPSISVLRNNITMAFKRTIPSINNIIPKIVETASWLIEYSAKFSRGIDENDLIGYAANLYGDVNGINQYNEYVDMREENDRLSAELLIIYSQELIDACCEYQVELEAAMQPVLSQFLSENDNINNCILAGIEKYAKEGNSISAIYNKMHYSSEPLDEDGRDFLELIIQNLIEDGLSHQSELNLREMLFSGPSTNEIG